VKAIVFVSKLLLLIALVGVLAYFNLSATWLDRLVHGVSGQSLSLADARGTLFHGDATLQFLQPDGVVLSLDRIAWTVSEITLIDPSIEYELIDIKKNRLIAKANLAFGNITIRDLAYTFPAELLAVTSDSIYQARAGGLLSVWAALIKIQGRSLEGDMKIQWGDFSLGLLPGRVLGTFDAEAEINNQEARIKLYPVEGMLAPSGSGSWRFGAMPELSIQIEALTTDPAIHDFLSIVGRKSGDGKYDLRIDKNTGLF